MSAAAPLRIAFVTPWFGPDLKGGAEQQAWQMTTRLAARGHRVDAITTCGRSFYDEWAADYYPSEVTRLAGVTVRRFPLGARDAEAFARLNGWLLSIDRGSLTHGVSPVPEDDARVWTDENVHSPELERYLEEHADDYDAFVFIPYLYGTTLRGLPRVAAKAWMQPCLHDEVYAYLPDIAAAMHASRGLLFLSAGERAVATRLYGPAVWAKGSVVGAGVEFEPLDRDRGAPLPAEVSGERYVLYLGRRDPLKGVELLVAAFRQWRQDKGEAGMTLVLAGPGTDDFGDPEQGVFDLGLVSDETRAALLWNCAALAMPSANESFSRVIFEAWYCGRPTLVRASCGATRIPVEECGGGWIAESRDEWSAALEGIAGSDDKTLAALGAAGRAYASKVADWSGILTTFEQCLSPPASHYGLERDPAQDPAAVHQLAPNLGPGDAISSEMFAIRRMLRGAGYRSDIVVRYFDPSVAKDAVRFAPDEIGPDDGLIYHHSIGSEVTPTAVAHPGPKALVYHNITPPEFFQPYRPRFAPLLRRGREDMWTLARAFPASAGVSRFNAEELASFGFERPDVLPLALDPAAWDSPPHPGWMRALGDGRRNVLFVGRVAPNKRQDRLVQAFASLRARVDARLVIAGSQPDDDAFVDRVKRLIVDLRLEADVVMVGHCGHADLHAFYRSADAFLSFSEHEGFCVPLIEAMWFDVPVVALASSAVPETLAGAGLTFSWDDDEESVAELVRRVIFDEALRSHVLAAQRIRRWDFTPERQAPHLARLLARMRSEQRGARPRAKARA